MSARTSGAARHAFCTRLLSDCRSILDIVAHGIESARRFHCGWPCGHLRRVLLVQLAQSACKAASGIADTTLALVASSPLRPPLLTQESDSSIITGDEILAEQFTRNLQFFGTAGQSVCQMRSSSSSDWAGLEVTARTCSSAQASPDCVSWISIKFRSPLNRHAVATREDVGTSKAGCLRRHFSKIYPEANLDCRTIMR